MSNQSALPWILAEAAYCIHILYVMDLLGLLATPPIVPAGHSGCDKSFPPPPRGEHLSINVH